MKYEDRVIAHYGPELKLVTTKTKAARDYEVIAARTVEADAGEYELEECLCRKDDSFFVRREFTGFDNELNAARSWWIEEHREKTLTERQARIWLLMAWAIEEYESMFGRIAYEEARYASKCASESKAARCASYIRYIGHDGNGNHRIEISTQDLYSVYGNLNEEIDEFGILEWDRMLAAEE